MDTTGHTQGYGKFEETAHELEQAAAEKAATAARAARGTVRGGIVALSAVVRGRPASTMLMACAAGYAVGWLSRD